MQVDHEAFRFVLWKGFNSGPLLRPPAMLLLCIAKKDKTQLLLILSLILTIALEISLLAFPLRPCVDLLHCLCCYV